MNAFPYFKTRFSKEEPAKTANCAKALSQISHFSHISTHNSENLGNVIPFPVPQSQKEDYEERAAIMQYDAGLSREQAEILAFYDIIKG